MRPQQPPAAAGKATAGNPTRTTPDVSPRPRSRPPPCPPHQRGTVFSRTIAHSPREGAPEITKHVPRYEGWTTRVPSLYILACCSGSKIDGPGGSCCAEWITLTPCKGTVSHVYQVYGMAFRRQSHVYPMPSLHMATAENTRNHSNPLSIPGAPECTHKVPKSASHAVLSRMPLTLHATRQNTSRRFSTSS